PAKISARSRQQRRNRGVEHSASSTNTAAGQAAPEREKVSARPSKMPDTMAATGRIRGSVAADLPSTQASSLSMEKFSAKAIQRRERGVHGSCLRPLFHVE